MTRFRALSVACVLLVSCDPSEPPVDGAPAEPDAGLEVMDGGPPDGGPEETDAGSSSTDAATCGAAPAAGCPCADEGAARCGVGASGSGLVCCGGEWQLFVDGPCAPPPDGGVPSCDLGPAAGCPCSTAGETACGGVASWRLRCEAGVWTEQVTGQTGRLCCG